MKYEDLRDEYRRLWDTALHTDAFAKASKNTARKIYDNKQAYFDVQQRLGVPWYVVGAVHAMESGCRFQTHLHNGDPLTRRTYHVPAGRPKSGKPPFTWAESANDALTMKGWHNIAEWPIERVLFECERYNGWGYRRYHKDVLSPYLWSGTQWGLKPGKYVADGKWSSTAHSGQTGVVAILMRLREIDQTIQYRRDGDAAPVTAPIPERPMEASEPEIVPKTYPKAEPAPVAEAVKSSRTITGALAAFLGTITSFFSETMKTLVDAAAQITEWSPANNVLASLGGNARGIGFAMAIAGLTLVVTRRLSAAKQGKVG